MLALCLAGRASADTTATFVLPSGVSVRIVEAPFKPSRFKIRGCTEGASSCLINGRIGAGTTGLLPKTYVKEIRITVGTSSYVLDSSDMYDAWGSRPLEHPGNIRYFGGDCVHQRLCQFRGIFSDGAGTFVAEWIIIDGVSARSVLSSNSDIVGLFMKNIDPPFIYD